MMNRVRFFLFCIILWIPFFNLAFCVQSDSTNSQDLISFQVANKRIDISSFYHGSSVSVDFSVPRGYLPVLKFEGDCNSIFLNRKGRVGIFWLNVDELKLENAPQVYQVYTSENLANLASPEILSQLKLGYDVLANQITIAGENSDKTAMLREFFKFKEENNLYQIANGKLQPDRIQDNKEQYSFRIPVSSSTPPGDYKLSLSIFKDGKLLKQFEETIVIRKIGFTKFISNLAVEHATEYGIFAILLAIIVGFSIGILFNYLKKK